MLARWDSEGNFESIFKKNIVSSEAKGIFKDIDDLDLNSKTIAWDKWADSMVKTDKNLKAFLITEDEAYKTKDLATYTKYLNDHNKTLDTATLKTKAWAFAKNAALNIGFTLVMMGISKAIDSMVNSQENAIKKADEFIEKFEEQRNTLTSNKKTIDSISSDYEKLAKGVDSLGRNVSLNTDEYARYNDIVNQIADMFPHMVQGYTDEGNAIIKCKGDVEELTQAYKDQKDAAQDAIIVGSAEVFAGFKASTDKDPEYIWEESGLLQMKELVDKIVATGGDVGKIQDIINDLGGNSLVIGDVFDKIGLDKGWFDWNTQDAEYISENIKKFQSLFNTLNTEVEAQAAKIKPIMQAYLEQSDKFQLADDKVQDMVKQIVGQFDAEFYSQFDTETQMASWVEENVIDKLRGNKDLVNDFSVMFDLQTKFNKGDITVTEYQEKLTAFLSLIDTLPDETQKAIKLLFGITTNDDGTTSSDVDTMVANVKEKFKGKFEKEIGQLKLDELEILTNLDISPDGIKDWSEVETLIANAGKEVNKMTVSLSDMKSASENISTLQKAFKELSDDGYITIETLSEIQTAANLSGDVWKKYENALLNARVGSAEFNQTMTELTYVMLENKFGSIDLTNATKEEISALEIKIATMLRGIGVTNADAVAHEYLTSVHGNLANMMIYTQIQSNILNGTFSTNIATLQATAAQAGITGSAFQGLVAKIAVANSATLGMENVIKTLQTVGFYASWSAEQINRIAKVKTISFGGQSYVGSLDENGQLLDVRSIPRIEIPDMPKITIPSFGGGGKGSGGGSDNKPDYEDLTDAIINRINLRAKELEQQEESIQNAIEIAELEKDYEKKVSLTNNLIATRKKRVNELNKANTELHNQAVKLRADNPWDEESWFDSQGNATESYYNLYNSSSKANQEKIKETFEKISKIKEAWVANDKELVELNKQLLQDAENLNELYDELANSKIGDIEHQIELNINNNGETFDNRTYYKQIQEIAHAEAERLRALDPEKYKEQIQEWQNVWWDAQHSIVDWRWEDSQNWIDQRNKYNDWALFGDSEVQAWERVVKWLREEYPDDIEKIKEAEESLFSARKAEFDKANNFANSYLESQKTLMQAHFDVENSIAEARHEINKELETSKTMYEYLDEETRKLLFNQEDYNELCKELNRIENEALRIQSDYEDALENSTLETLESITSEYQMQYETLMKSYEIAKADLEIAKKKQQLNNVLNERNVKMFINGSWQWVANTENVEKAKSELADAEYAKQVEQAGLTQQESINNLTKQQDALGVVVKKFEGGVISLGEAVSIAGAAILNLPSSIRTMLEKAGVDTPSYSSGSSSRSFGGVWYDSNTNYMNNIQNATSEAEVRANNAARNAKIAGDGIKDQDIMTDEDAIAEWRANRHADGTRYTPGGLTVMGEEGFEAYVSSKGRLIPISQPTIGNIPSGGVVFNQDQMKNLRTLWDMSNLKIGTGESYVNVAQPQQVDQSQDNRIIINGMTVDSGSADGQALISALRRYVGNH